MAERAEQTEGGRAAAGGPSVQGSLTFIGTATVLLRYGGFTILTDPNFLHAGETAPLGYGLRSRRLTDPAMELADLPPVDLVVLSHHHGDHFDPGVVREMAKDQPIVTEPHSARKLRRQGFHQVVALETWAAHTIASGTGRLTVTAAPGRHAPRGLQAVLPKVMGSILTFSHDGVPTLRVYVTGDTLAVPDLAEIPRRFPGIDLCLLHLGGTRVAGVLLTMDGEQGVRALRLVQPKTAVPIHVDDYTVFRSPYEDFERAVAAADLPTEIVRLERGETWTFQGNPPPA